MAEPEKKLLPILVFLLNYPLSLLAAPSPIAIIPGIDNPQAITSNPITNRIYVANGKLDSNDTITVIDSATSRGIASIATSFVNTLLAVNTATNRLYAGNTAGKITVIDGNTNTILGSPITVGGTLNAIASNPTTNRIYVTNAAGILTIIDGATNNIVTTLSDNTYSGGIVVNPSTNRVYVSSTGGLKVFDGANNSIVATISGIGGTDLAINTVTNRIYAPSGNGVIVADANTNSVITNIFVESTIQDGYVSVNSATNRIYLVDNYAITLVVIDGNNNSILTSVPIDYRTIGVEAIPATNQVYTISYRTNRALLIDGSTSTLAGTALTLGANAISVRVNSQTNRIYVANNEPNNFPQINKVSVVDGSNNHVIANIPVGINLSGVGVNEVTNTVYAVTNDQLAVIDGSTNTVSTNVSLSSQRSGGGVGVNSQTNRVYITDAEHSILQVLDGTANTFIGNSISVGNRPEEVAVNPQTNRIYVANTQGNSVSVVDGSNNMVIATIPTGKFPYGIDINPVSNRIYTANSIDNSVTVIDGTTNTVITTVAVEYAPNELAVDSVLNRVYVSNNLGTTPGNDSGMLTVIDGATNNIITSVPTLGRASVGVGLNRTTHTVYVSNFTSSNMSVISGLLANIVTNPEDDGQGTTVGTLSYALTHTTNGDTITFKLSAGNKVTVKNPLPQVPAGVNISGDCTAKQPGIVLDDSQISTASAGLILKGNSNVTGLKIAGFKGSAINASGKGNKLQCIATSH